MATDPEFLAMRTIDRALKTLPDQTAQQRVVDWCVSKVQSPLLQKSEVAINPAIQNAQLGATNVSQGQTL